MLIKNLAFKVDIPSWTTTTQYVDYLISKNCQTFGISDEYLIAIHRDQIMINNVQTPICSGVILRTKDARTFTTLADADGSLTVEAEELEDGTSIVDFNHFIINENNGMGIYQHYYQSVTLPGFLKILGRQFHDFESTPTNRVIDKSGCDPFNVEQYMTQAGLSEMVRAMNKITKVEYKLVASAEDSRFGIPSIKLEVQH